MRGTYHSRVVCWGMIAGCMLSLGLLESSRGDEFQNPQQQPQVNPNKKGITSIERPFLDENAEYSLCGATCEELGACNRTDVPDPTCDPWGTSTCSDYTSITYNPNGTHIQVAHFYGGCTKYHGYTLPTEALCSIYTWWTEGNSLSWSSCSNDPPNACVGTFPVPLFCQQCAPTERLNSWVPNEACTYDSECCEPMITDPTS